MKTTKNICNFIDYKLAESPASVNLRKVGMNSVFEVAMPSGVIMMLKIYSADRSHIAEKEFLILQSARAGGVTVPDVSSHGYYANNAYILYGKVPGKDLEFDGLSSDEQNAFIKDLVDNLGRFNNLPAKSFGSITEKEPQHATWREFLKVNVSQGLDDLAKIEVLTSREYRSLALYMKSQPTCKTSCMVWGDLKPENIIIQDNRLAAMVDFESCFYGDPALSLGYLYAIDADSSFYLSILKKYANIYEFNQNDIYYYAALRLLRISRYLKLALPSGLHRQPILQYFKGIRNAINFITY